MRNIHLFVWFSRGRTNFRVTGLASGDYNGADPAYKSLGLANLYSMALESHYENLSSYIKKFQPNSIEIRNDLLKA